MSVTWHVVRGTDGRVEPVEGYESIDEAIREMAVAEDASNRWGNFVTDDAGIVVAMAVFYGQALLVACADGRLFRAEMPDDAGEIGKGRQQQ